MAVDLDRRPMLIALAGATAISFSPVLFIYSDTNPSTGAFFRMLYALPALALLAYLVRNADTRSSRTRWLAFGAGLILAPDMLVYHSAMIFIGIGIATLIGNSQVIIVTLASWKMFGEKPNPAILISLPIVMIGLALISGIGDSDPYGEDPVKGVIFGIIGALFYSFFLMFKAKSKILIKFIREIKSLPIRIMHYCIHIIPSHNKISCKILFCMFRDRQRTSNFILGANYYNTGVFQP